MGYRYSVTFKNNKDHHISCKISKYFITALFYLIYYSIRYDNVNLIKRRAYE